MIYEHSEQRVSFKILEQLMEICTQASHVLNYTTALHMSSNHYCPTNVCFAFTENKQMPKEQQLPEDAATARCSQWRASSAQAAIISSPGEFGTGAVT
jgi:hypothetical protein